MMTAHRFGPDLVQHRAHNGLLGCRKSHQLHRQVHATVTAHATGRMLSACRPDCVSAAWQVKRAMNLVHKPALRLGMLKKAALQVRKQMKTNMADCDCLAARAWEMQ